MSQRFAEMRHLQSSGMKVLTWRFWRVRMMLVAMPNSVISCVISASVVSGGRPRRCRTRLGFDGSSSDRRIWPTNPPTTNQQYQTRARIVQIFCTTISCEIPRRYRDIVAVFCSPFAASALSCSSSESARKLTTSVSPFLFHGGCSRDGLSWPVCSTSSYTVQHFVHM